MMSTLRNFVQVSAVALFLLCVQAFSLSAWAQEPAQSQPSLAQARTAFLEGRELMNQGRYEDAGERFSFAARVKNTPGLRYYIAYCLERQDLLLEALDEYKKSALLLETQPAADVEELVPAAIERVKEQLPHVVLHGLVEGALVSLDGDEPQKRDSMFVNPGRREIRVTAPGYEPHEEVFEATRGATKLIKVTMSPVKAHSTDPKEAAPQPLSGKEQFEVTPARRAVFWSSATLGILGLGAGLVGTGLYIKASGDVKDSQRIVDEPPNGDSSAGLTSCTNPTRDDLVAACEDLRRAEDQKEAGQIIMIAGYATAGAGLLAALGTQIFWPRTKVQVSGVPLLGGGGLSLRTEF